MEQKQRYGLKAAMEINSVRVHFTLLMNRKYYIERQNPQCFHSIRTLNYVILYGCMLSVVLLQVKT